MPQASRTNRTNAGRAAPTITPGHSRPSRFALWPMGRPWTTQGFSSSVHIVCLVTEPGTSAVKVKPPDISIVTKTLIRSQAKSSAEQKSYLPNVYQISQKPGGSHTVNAAPLPYHSNANQPPDTCRTPLSCPFPFPLAPGESTQTSTVSYHVVPTPTSIGSIAFSFSFPSSSFPR